MNIRALVTSGVNRDVLLYYALEEYITLLVLLGANPTYRFVPPITKASEALAIVLPKIPAAIGRKFLGLFSSTPQIPSEPVVLVGQGDGVAPQWLTDSLAMVKFLVKKGARISWLN